MTLTYWTWLGGRRRVNLVGDQMINARGRTVRPVLGAWVNGWFVLAVFIDGGVFRLRRFSCAVDAAWARALRLQGQ